MKYIKLSALYYGGKEGDSFIYINPERIMQIHSASPMDKKHRSDINSIIMTLNGPIAVLENPSVILAKIEEAERESALS